MLHSIPLFPLADIGNAKICGKVDHLDPGLNQGLCLLHCDSVGCGKKDYVTCSKIRQERINKTEINPTTQAWKHVGNRKSSLTPRSDCPNLHTRMLRQETQEFHTGITGSANNTNLDHARPQRK